MNSGDGGVRRGAASAAPVVGDDGEAHGERWRGAVGALVAPAADCNIPKF